MEGRGKVWKKLKDLALPTALAVAATLAPVETNFSKFNSRSPLEERNVSQRVLEVNNLMAEEQKEDTNQAVNKLINDLINLMAKQQKEDTDDRPVVYLPQAAIDSAFAWKYGKVEKKNGYILKNFDYPKLIKLGHGWAIRISPGVVSIRYLDGSSPIGKEIGGWVTDDYTDPNDIGAETFKKHLKTDEVEFLVYTDEYGNNLLIVKHPRIKETETTYYQSINVFCVEPSGELLPGFGVIATIGRDPLIGDIGVFREKKDVLGVLVKVKGDGIIGIGIKLKEKEKGFTDEVKVVSSR